MTRFNLSEWAVNNKAIVVFLMLLCAVAGVSAYERLGRQEDPDFSVQTMVIQVAWPGATTLDTLKQVTDRLEKKLEETPRLDYIKSYTKPGQSTVFVYLKESTPKRDLPDIWYQVRKKVSDIQATLPKGVVGPFFNDEFGDVFGIVYGITYDGFTPREARDFAETARAEFLRSPDVGKVEIFGDQDEKIYLDFSPQKLANLKLSLDDVLTAIAQQNAVVPSGVINTARENVLVDVTGALLTPQGIANLNLWVNGRFYKLTDIAQVRSGYSDPPTKMFRVNGRPAIGIGVNMASGGNNLTFGAGLHEAAQRLMQRLPIGIELNLVSDQPQVVKEALGSFTKALFEAIAIVLAVSFLSLGVRAGVVVALSIPLVLAIVFVSMKVMDISLQRISLGALIIALGLLVDDAMITIEMMISKIEEGMEKVKAATFALYLDRLPDVDRHADHHLRLSADRLRRQQHRAIHLLALRRYRRGARRVLVRGRHLRPGDRARHAAVAHEGASRGRARPLHARFRLGARLEHAASLAHHHRLARRFLAHRSLALASSSSSSSRLRTGRNCW